MFSQRRLLTVLGSTLAATLSTIAALPQRGFAAGLAAQAIDDAAATRRVHLLVAGMAFLGLSIAGLTIWFWQTTRPHHRSLDPLEVMSRRSFARTHPHTRERLLEAARSDAPGLLVPVEAPAVDLAALAAQRSPRIDEHGGFADLADAAIPSDGATRRAEPDVWAVAAGPAAEPAAVPPDTLPDEAEPTTVQPAALAGPQATAMSWGPPSARPVESPRWSAPEVQAPANRAESLVLAGAPLAEADGPTGASVAHEGDAAESVDTDVPFRAFRRLDGPPRNGSAVDSDRSLPPPTPSDASPRSD